MSSKRVATVGYRWHLRMVMAARGMFATSELQPMLASRGVTLSREQIYRLVAKVPERLNLTTLAALCDILECTPADLIEPLPSAPKTDKATTSTPAAIRPRRAQVSRTKQ